MSAPAKMGMSYAQIARKPDTAPTAPTPVAIASSPLPAAAPAKPSRASPSVPHSGTPSSASIAVPLTQGIPHPHTPGAPAQTSRLADTMMAATPLQGQQPQRQPAKAPLQTQSASAPQTKQPAVVMSETLRKQGTLLFSFSFLLACVWVSKGLGARPFSSPLRSQSLLREPHNPPLTLILTNN